MTIDSFLKNKHLISYFYKRPSIPLIHHIMLGMSDNCAVWLKLVYNTECKLLVWTLLFGNWKKFKKDIQYVLRLYTFNPLLSKLWLFSRKAWIPTKIVFQIFQKLAIIWKSFIYLLVYKKSICNLNNYIFRPSRLSVHIPFIRLSLCYKFFFT